MTCEVLPNHSVAKTSLPSSTLGDPPAFLPWPPYLMINRYLKPDVLSGTDLPQPALLAIPRYVDVKSVPLVAQAGRPPSQPCLTPGSHVVSKSSPIFKICPEWVPFSLHCCTLIQFTIFSPALLHQSLNWSSCFYVSPI